MNRRTLLGGIVGLGAIGASGVVYQRRRTSTTTVRSDDEETTVHHPESVSRPDQYPVPDGTVGEPTGEDSADETDDEDEESDDADGTDDPHPGSGDDDENDSSGSPPRRREPRGDTDDGHGEEDQDADSTSIDIEFTRENLGGFNSGSVSFVHEVFIVCNRGDECATVWIEADPIENEHGDPSVGFYRDGVLEDRLEDPDEVVCLEPDDCLTVGVITRTAGIAADTLLLDEIRIRTER